MTPPLWQKVKRTKETLDESERGEWKSWLKAQHSENEDNGSGPVTSWQIDEETVETVSDFIFWGSKITADCDCSHKIKICLLLGRKVMTNLDSILKSRHYFANKGPSSQGYDFSSGHVWMWESDSKESWVPRIDAFELWCWGRLLRVPWTARTSNKSILKENSPGCSWKDGCCSWNSNSLASWGEELTHLKRPWC